MSVKISIDTGRQRTLSDSRQKLKTLFVGAAMNDLRDERSQMLLPDARDAVVSRVSRQNFLPLPFGGF
jgi:hypothetical protein